MNTAFFSQRSSGCCNLRCSISRTDRDATYTSLTGRGRYGINLFLSFSVSFLLSLSVPLFLLSLAAEKWNYSNLVSLYQLKHDFLLFYLLKMEASGIFRKRGKLRGGGGVNPQRQFSFSSLCSCFSNYLMLFKYTHTHINGPQQWRGSWNKSRSNCIW